MAGSARTRFDPPCAHSIARARFLGEEEWDKSMAGINGGRRIAFVPRERENGTREGFDQFASGYLVPSACHEYARPTGWVHSFGALCGHASSRGKTMQDGDAAKPAAALVLSAHRGEEMLVRRRE
jgi:hypothetical protein